MNTYIRFDKMGSFNELGAISLFALITGLFYIGWSEYERRRT